jgi:copper(I)-binding protein
VTDLKVMTMLRTLPRLPRSPRLTRRDRAPGSARGRALRGTGALALAVTLGGTMAGCAQRAVASAPTIELATAYVGAPRAAHPTDAYLVIRNNGPADKLIAVHSSAGGTVTMRGPAGNGRAALRNLSAVAIPSHTLTRLSPNGYHLVITGSRPMKAGTDITLTLVFAKAGSFQVQAEVTNPETGGSSYFLN